jgi:hypothetical protein
MTLTVYLLEGIVNYQGATFYDALGVYERHLTAKIAQKQFPKYNNFDITEMTVQK